MTVSAPGPATGGPQSDVPRKLRAKVPTRLQIEVVECGAACLGMILEKYGRYVSPDEMRDRCGVSRDGSNMADLFNAADSFGLRAKGYRRARVKLRAVHMPAIIFWDYRHFVVLEGWKDDRWYINDPATGPRVLDDEEFSEGYSGVVLELIPGDDFEKGGSKPSPLRSLGGISRPIRPALALLTLVGMILVLPTLAVPSLTKAFVDSYLIGGNPQIVPTILIGIIGAGLLTVAAAALQQRTFAAAQTVLRIRLGAELVERLIGLPMRFFQQRNVQDLARRTDMATVIASVLSGPLAQAALGVSTVILATVLLFWMDFWLALLVLATTVVFAIVRIRMSKQEGLLAERETRDFTELAVVAGATVELFETVKASGNTKYQLRAFADRFSTLGSTRQATDSLSLVAVAAPTFMVMVGQVAILCVGAARVMTGALTIGTLVAVQMLSRMLLGPVAQLVSTSGQIQQLKGALARVDDISRQTPSAHLVDNGNEPSAIQAPTFDSNSVNLLRGHVELRNVDFGYSPLRAPLLKDFSFVAAPGRRIALVGSSGSGKSTAARLVVGLADPWRGEVLLDGVDRRYLPPALCADGLGMVEQDVSLLAGSVRDNLTLWDEQIPDADLVAALEDAQISDDIFARPGGLDSQLGEAGRGLSGGQRQRLGIARALCRNPRILVLDEATSALDPVTEALVDAAIKRRGCTTIVVAHRLSTVRDADEIIVLHQGEIVERGTHFELMANDGAYARLVHEY